MQPTNTLTTKEKIQFGLLGIVVLGGVVLIGRNVIRNVRANTEERKTYEDGSAAAIAKQIKMAFDNDGWWGTDKEMLRQAVRSIGSKEDFVQVMASYQKLFNKTLMRDMQDELKTTEYTEMLAILAAKPDKAGSGNSPIGMNDYLSWAKRLNAAFNIYYGIIPGTDEEAIKAVFLEIPSQAAYQQVATVYRQTYGIDLKRELTTELEIWEYAPMMKLITNKPTT